MIDCDQSARDQPDARIGQTGLLVIEGAVLATELRKQVRDDHEHAEVDTSQLPKLDKCAAVTMYHDPKWASSWRANGANAEIHDGTGV